MSDIVSKMKQEIINRSNLFEKQTKGTKDEYNIYREHIQYVYKYVCLLSKDKNIDDEVLKLSALLHDISMTDKNLDRSKHNEYSSEIASKILEENGYSEEKIKLVKKCILNHSSKRAEFRTTEEEKILVNADGLSHFDSINNLYSLAHNVMDLNDDKCIKFIQNKLTKDYDEISNELKYLIQDKYDKVMNANSISEILDNNKGFDYIMNKELLKIRKVKPEDARDWIVLCNNVWKDTYAHIFPEAVFIERDNQVEEKIKTFIYKMKNDKENIAYVAEYDGKIIGIMSGSIKSSYDKFNSEYADLTVLYIDSKYQGLGIGSSLKNIFEQWAIENGATKYVIGVLKDNLKARKVYESWSGKLSKYEQDFIKLGVGYPEVFYTYDLKKS